MRNRKTQQRSKRTIRRQGYLLLTVVVMIAVAALILARVATTSMRVATTAVNEEQDLRQRWAQTSLRRFSLDSATRLLAGKRLSQVDSQALSSGTENESVMWANVKLAGKQWRVIVADESAKLNLIHSSRELNDEVLNDLAQNLLPTNARVSLTNDLNELGGQRAARWEHWFESTNQARQSPRVLAHATQQVTLWGQGRLNVCQSDASTVDALWRALFGNDAPNELHSMRKEYPPPTTGKVIRALALRESQASLARQWLTTTSDCYSVWIFCQSDRRVPASLYVEWGAGGVATEHRGYEY